MELVSGPATSAVIVNGTWAAIGSRVEHFWGDQLVDLDEIRARVPESAHLLPRRLGVWHARSECRAAGIAPVVDDELTVQQRSREKYAWCRDIRRFQAFSQCRHAGKVSAGIAHACDSITQEQTWHHVRQSVVVQEMHMHVPETGHQKATAAIQRFSRGRGGSVHSRNGPDQIAVNDNPLVLTRTTHCIDDRDVFDGNACGRD